MPSLGRAGLVHAASWAVLPALILLLAAACGATPAAAPLSIPAAVPSATPTPQPLVSLPQDDASHPVNTEWWYYNGQLVAEDGSRYGFHLVVFEVLSPDGGPVFHIGQFAVTDHQRGTYTTAQRLMPRLLDPPDDGFRLILGDWVVSGGGGEDTLAASAGEYTLRLGLSPGKPAVLHAGDGLVEFPLAGDSFYYSRTRMPGWGTLTDHGRQQGVLAQVWMDHQWGDFTPAAIGWDWFSIHLDDATDIMLSVVRTLAGEVVLKYGTLVAADGGVTSLAADEFQVEATGTWTSPQTGAVYPSGWRLSIPRLDLSLTLTPVVRDAEFDSRDTTQNYYWEGEVTGTGTQGGESRSAVGFVELVGY